MSRRGAANANWRGGRVRGGEKCAYWLRHLPGHPNASRQGYVLEHRLVMEKHLGRYLTPDEIVHHVNHDTLDNRIENLEVMTQAEHARGHDTLRGRGYIRPPVEPVRWTCEACGTEWDAKGKDRHRRRFCSARCYWAYRRRVGGQLQRGVPA